MSQFCKLGDVCGRGWKKGQSLIMWLGCLDSAFFTNHCFARSPGGSPTVLFHSLSLIAPAAKGILVVSCLTKWHWSERILVEFFFIQKEAELLRSVTGQCVLLWKKWRSGIWQNVKYFSTCRRLNCTSWPNGVHKMFLNIFSHQYKWKEALFQFFSHF